MAKPHITASKDAGLSALWKNATKACTDCERYIVPSGREYLFEAMRDLRDLAHSLGTQPRDLSFARDVMSLEALKDLIDVWDCKVDEVECVLYRCLTRH